MPQFGTLELPVSSQPPTEIVSKKGLAEVLGVHPSRITQLIGKGLPLEPNGRVSITKAKDWIAANVDQHRRKMLGGTGQQRPGTAVRVELDSVRVERARLELERERGNLIDRKAVEAAVFARARSERDAHMAWVVRTAPIVAVRLGIDAAALLAALEAEMRVHLQDLASRPIGDLSP